MAPETSATATLVADGRAGRWQVNYRQSLDGLTRGSLDAVVVADPGHLARSPLTGTIALQSDNPRATLAQLQRLGVPLPAVVSTIDVNVIGAEGTLTGSLADPRVTGHVGLQGGRIGDLSQINVLGGAALDRRALTVSTLAIHTTSSEVVLDGVLPWSGATGRGTIVAHLGEVGELGVGLPMLWRPVGALEVSGEWSGSARSPAMTAHVSGAGIGVNGLLLEAVSGDLSFADGVVTVKDLTATQPDGTFNASGSWRLDDSSLTASLRARNLAMELMAQGATGYSEVGRLERPLARRRHLGSGDATGRRRVAGCRLGGVRSEGRGINAASSVQRPQGSRGSDGRRRARDGECAERWRQYRRAPDPRHTVAIRRPRCSHAAPTSRSWRGWPASPTSTSRIWPRRRTPPWTCPERFRTSRTSMPIWR